MPAANGYTTDQDTKEYKAQRSAAAEELQKRSEVFTRNWNYYAGNHKKWLKTSADGISDNVILNLCKQAVDRKVSFLFPDLPQIILNQDGNTDETERQLADDWTKNGGAALLVEMATTGSIAGHVVARVTVADGQPKIINLLPTNVLVWWNADNFRDVLWYEIQWSAAGQNWRQDIVPDGARWLIRNFVQKGNQYELMTEEIWPYELSPIVAWPHKRNPKLHYGDDEFGHAVLNDMVNLTASNIAKILRFHAHPLTVTDDKSLGKDNFIESGPSKLVKVSQGSRVWNVEMQSDLSSSMNFLNMLVGMFNEQSKIVTLPADLRVFSNVTNFGIRAAFLPMSDDNERLQRQYGWGITEISKRLLMLRGKRVEREPIVKWGEALPVNAAEATNTLVTQYNAGFTSRKQASESLGYDWGQVQADNSEDAQFAGELYDKFLGLQVPMSEI